MHQTQSRGNSTFRIKSERFRAVNMRPIQMMIRSAEMPYPATQAVMIMKHRSGVSQDALAYMDSDTTVHGFPSIPSRTIIHQIDHPIKSHKSIFVNPTSRVPCIEIVQSRSASSSIFPLPSFISAQRPVIIQNLSTPATCTRPSFDDR